MTDGAGAGKPRLGKVASFDEDRGLGKVLADDGTELAFHSKQIAGRADRLPEGARVVFVTVPGHLGRLEAAGITVVTLSADSPGASGTDVL